MMVNHRNIKFFQYIQLYFIFFLNSTLIIQIYVLSSPLNGRSPNSLLLQNGKLFLTNVNGMFVCDTGLREIYKEYIYYNKTVDTPLNTEIVQFKEENGMILCLVENAIYFFDYEGQFLYMDFLPYSDYQGYYLNLLTYKVDNDDYYYIITYIEYDYLNILYYKTNNAKNELILHEMFKPFYFDFPKISFSNNALGCQIMNCEEVGKVLTCSFQTKNGPFIIIQSFIIENKFEPIGDNVYAKVQSPNSNIIRSIASQNEKRLLTCYREENASGYCLIYDIDLNKIIRNDPLIKKCSDSYQKFKLFYDKNYGKYVLACLSEDRKLTIMLIDNNFNVLNYNNFSNYNFDFNYDFNTFSLLYDEQETKYSFIIDPYVEVNKNNTTSEYLYHTGKYCITTNFSENFDGGEPPSPFEESSPETEIIQLHEDNRYYLNVKEFYRGITVNEKDGIIIDLINEKIIETISKKQFNKEIYGLKFKEMPEGQLKYIINGTEKDVFVNEIIYGQFKLKYIPTENYQKQDKFVYSIYLRNISIASEVEKYWLIICKKNCSCLNSIDECNICADGYSSFEWVGNCILGTDICSNRFYTDNITYLMVCINETENNCPMYYPIYNEKTKECKQIKINTSSEVFIENTNDVKTIITYPDTGSESDFSNQTTLLTSSPTTKNNDKESTIIEERTDIYEDFINEENIRKILYLIYNYNNFNNTENIEETEQPDKTYRLLSHIIQNEIINITPYDEDIILKGSSIIYQITNSNNQKNADKNEDYSIIDLGECEKLIKRNISYEDDPTPLIILKIDIKKEEIKSNIVKYEVYNPYTKKKIDLEICADIKIKIISPVNLTSEETTIYDDLKNQGYERYNENDSFYQDICTQYTSQNGTDVILSDRKNYYYDKNATFCENYCIYKGINTDIQKVVCFCDVQNNVDFDSLTFDTEKFLGNFYKVKDYTNYQVLQCFNLVFSLKGIINNILFYIYLILFILFLSSMIVNLFKAMKKVDDIIFTIFRDRFMYEIMKNIINSKKAKPTNEKNKRDSKDENNNNEKDEEPDSDIKKTKKINIFEKLKLKYRKEDEAKNNNNINNDNNNMNNDNNNNDNNNNDNNINNDNINNNIINNDNISSNRVSNNSNKKNKNSKNNKNNIYKIKKSKLDSDKKKPLKYRMKYKLNYSNDIRDKNFNFSNMLNRILKTNQINSSPLDKKNQNLINDNKNMNILSKIKKNNTNTSINKNLFITNIFNINLKDNYINSSLPQGQINDINQTNINNINNINNIYPNPPINKKKVNKKSPLTKISSDNNIIFKNQNNIKNLALKNIDIFNYKSNNLLSNNTALISLRNEDTLSKNQLLQKPCPIRPEKQLINENETKKVEKHSEESKFNNKIRYIDEEINKMNYENALINDNRTYFQYYISLLKKKHLIILVFISNDDYNVFLLKFSLFIISIAIFFSLNTLFFRDSTMTYIFMTKGKYDFLYQIPQILYSTIISFVIIYILKILSLSQSDLIKIKKESNKKKAKIMANIAKRCLTIKLYIFFFIGIILLIFCWYYITAFGAVYPNTQLHLIKDTLISFGISMLYPFLINIIPGIFRMPALKSKNKDKKCLYNFSKIIAWF